MKTKMKPNLRNALYIGTLCAVSYLAVYVARNILSAVTPQMLETGNFTKDYIGNASSIYFIFYAVGQLINGIIGDKIKAKYMLSMGLFLAGVTNFVFPYLAGSPQTALYIYGMTGFFLAMIYAPMTKVVAENTDPIYTTRCSLGYTFASFLGSPLAGVIAGIMAWQSVFATSSIILFAMAITCFVCFTIFERKGIVKYGQYDRKTESGKKPPLTSSLMLLIRRQIIKFSFIALLTGVVRTTVVFWLPTYIAEYLNFPADKAAFLFTAATLVICSAAFISVFVYERLGNNMDLTILVMFTSSTLFFGGCYLVSSPIPNMIFIVLAVISANAAATMLWSKYCPSLRDTGMVSSATGFLDFLSYMAAAASNAFSSFISWQILIAIWFALMVFGVIIALPFDKLKKKS